MKEKKNDFAIITDSREQKPFIFPGYEVIVKKLDAGDYSIEGSADRVAVERKSLSDLFGTVGKGRARFVRELERLSKFDYAAIVCEGSWQDVFFNPPPQSKMSPKSIFGSLLAWSMRYNLHLWMCPNRDFAEKATLKILERYYKDNVLNKK